MSASFGAAIGTLGAIVGLIVDIDKPHHALRSDIVDLNTGQVTRSIGVEAWVVIETQQALARGLECILFSGSR